MERPGSLPQGLSSSLSTPQPSLPLHLKCIWVLRLPDPTVPSRASELHSPATPASVAFMSLFCAPQNSLECLERSSPALPKPRPSPPSHRSLSVVSARLFPTSSSQRCPACLLSLRLYVAVLSHHRPLVRMTTLLGARRGLSCSHSIPVPVVVFEQSRCSGMNE